MPERDEMNEVAILMEQISKNLEGLGEFRKRFNEVLVAVDARIEKLEKRIEGIQPKEHTHKDLKESIEKVVNYIEEVEKLAKEDNKYMEGLDHKLEEHIESTNERFKGFSKEIVSIRSEDEKTNRFRVALRDFIKAVLGD